MNRIALAERLGGLSKVFASHTPFYRELAAMAYVLNKMDDDKFKTTLAGDFAEGLPAKECTCEKEEEAMPVEQNAVVPEEGAPEIIVVKKEEENPMSEAKDSGMFWSKAASKAVVDNLLRDVVGMDKSICCDTGRKLDKEQIPDGTHAGVPEKPATLKTEQTPNIAPVIESKIVEKSHGKVEKEASTKNAGIEEIEKKKVEEHSEKADEETEKAQELTEKADKALEKAKEHDEKAKEHAENISDKEVEANITVEGLELTASMDDITLSDKEASELSKIFE